MLLGIFADREKRLLDKILAAMLERGLNIRQCDQKQTWGG